MMYQSTLPGFPESVCRVCRAITNTNKQGVCAGREKGCAKRLINLAQYRTQDSINKTYRAFTPEDFELLLRRQAFRCARPGCETTMQSWSPNHAPELHIDHWHNDTLRVRGLLCSNCNSSLRERQELLGQLSQWQWDYVLFHSECWSCSRWNFDGEDVHELERYLMDVNADSPSSARPRPAIQDSTRFIAKGAPAHEVIRVLTRLGAMNDEESWRLELAVQEQFAPHIESKPLIRPCWS